MCAGEIEARAVDLAHDICDLVSDRLLGAPVLVGGDGWDIESAMPECPEGQRRVTDVSLVGEHDLHDGNIANHRGRDGGDEKEDGGEEDEDSAYAMEPAKHDGGIDCTLRDV